MKAAEKHQRAAQLEAERAQTALTKADARAAAVEKQTEIEARYSDAREQPAPLRPRPRAPRKRSPDAERSLAKAKEALDP